MILSVSVPPTATISSTSATAFFGGTVSFSCLVEAFPSPNITWRHNSTAIDINSQGYNLSVANGIFTNNTIVLTDVNLDDIGEYSCQAENDLAELRVNVSKILDLEIYCECFLHS